MRPDDNRLDHISTQSLERTSRHLGWAGLICGYAALAMLVLGVWVDWRWFVTALVPGAVAVPCTAMWVVGAGELSDRARREAS